MSEFTELPRSLQRQIDAAFDKARVLPSDPVETGLVPPAAKRRRIEEEDEGEQTNYHDEDSDEGGGFLVDDDDDDEPGGFEAPVVEKDEEEVDPSPDTIGLSLIPAALQLLDLPPDDGDVLSAFRNAAGGWGVQNAGEQSVSRAEWREVTAILLQHRVPTTPDDENAVPDPPKSRRRTKQVVDEEDSDPMALVESDVDADSADEFRDDSDPDHAQPDNSSDEDYGAPARKSLPSTRRTRRRRPSTSSSSSDEGPRKPTPRQKTEARKTFGLFFPDSPDEELGTKRIMIKDLTRVSKVLGIKLKAEEIVEMLEMYSTSPDKSIGLADFERLVMSMKLV